MLRRKSKRINVCITADLTTITSCYSGFIADLSEGGFCMRISSAGTGIQLTPGSIVDIETDIIALRGVRLTCRIVWCYETPRGKSGMKSVCRSGMEIIEARSEYKEYYKKLLVTRLKRYMKLYGVILSTD